MITFGWQFDFSNPNLNTFVIGIERLLNVSTDKAPLLQYIFIYHLFSVGYCATYLTIQYGEERDMFFCLAEKFLSTAILEVHLLIFKLKWPDILFFFSLADLSSVGCTFLSQLSNLDLVIHKSWWCRVFSSDNSGTCHSHSPAVMLGPVLALLVGKMSVTSNTDWIVEIRYF